MDSRVHGTPPSLGRYALSENATIVPALETVLAGGLILRAVVPSVRRFVAGKFKDDNVLALGTFENFRAPMNRKKFNRMLLKSGRSQFPVLVQLGRIASLFTNDYGVGGHNFIPSFPQLQMSPEFAAFLRTYSIRGLAGGATVFHTAQPDHL
jgi:hypothetical protein